MNWMNTNSSFISVQFEFEREFEIILDFVSVKMGWDEEAFGWVNASNGTAITSDDEIKSKRGRFQLCKVQLLTIGKYCHFLGKQSEGSQQSQIPFLKE